jgi:hypothetical protein
MSRWILPAAAAGALVLSACGAEEDAGASAPVENSPSSVETTLDTTPAEDATPPAGQVEYTPQGTALALGDKAVVPFRAGGEEGLVGVTITKIDKGAPADLAALELGARADGYVPYYIRITVTNETGGDWGGTSLVSLQGLLADGTEAGGVYSVPTSFAPCGKGSAGDDFVAVGASYETCTLAIAPDPAEVTGVAYKVDTYDDAAPEGAEADYASAPITWK